MAIKPKETSSNSIRSKLWPISREHLLLLLLEEVATVAAAALRVDCWWSSSDDNGMLQ